jgi:hypothetical protein
MEEISIEFSMKESLESSDYRTIFELCEELLPSPNEASIMLAKSTREEKVNSYLDENVLKAFNVSKYGVEFRIDYSRTYPSVSISKPRCLISIPLIKKDEYILAKEIALRLVENLNLKKLEVSPVDFRSFHRKYRKNQRTIDFPGLYWLQYYGDEEFKKQGGKAILDNPYIEAQLIKDGIFIEVGKSPYDVHTPEGEELMIKANQAMPPVVEE